MRKYDSKNKSKIGIIVVICIVFAIVFSYFLIKEIKISQIKYELDQSTLVFDIDKNNILLDEPGIIKKKWNKQYYLTYMEEQYQIGPHVIAFNNNEISLTLYGEFYQVNKNSEIEITKEETKLNNLSISRFYKIADRKYLIVDSTIRTEDLRLQTQHYLIVELDKLGNAILYNNNLNLKTFSETKLVTSTYTFDIANELLIYDDEKIVDLKKILGTTNEYKEPEEDKNGSGGGSGDGTGTNTGSGEGTGSGGGGGGGGSGDGTGTGTGDGEGTGSGGGSGEGSGDGSGGTQDEKPDTGKDDEINSDEGGNDITDNEIINETSNTSIIRINPSITSISVDYVIYDVMNKYLSTYVELRSDNYFKIIHLSKSTTNIDLTGLAPNTEYTLTFKYTHIDEGTPKVETIDEHKVKTLTPNITLVGTKVTNKEISYKITIDSYSITSATLRIYINGELQDSKLKINNENLIGKFNIRNIDFSNTASPQLVTLSLEDIYINEYKINKKITWSYVRNIKTDIPQTPDKGSE